MSSANVEAVRSGIGAFVRRDVEALVALGGPRFEMHLSGVLGEPVSYRGAEGIRQYFRDTGEHWASLSFELETIQECGEQVLAIGRQRARGRASGVELEAPAAFVVVFDRGRAAALRFFADPSDAIRAVGLDERSG